MALIRPAQRFDSAYCDFKILFIIFDKRLKMTTILLGLYLFSYSTACYHVINIFQEAFYPQKVHWGVITILLITSLFLHPIITVINPIRLMIAYKQLFGKTVGYKTAFMLTLAILLKSIKDNIKNDEV